MKRIVATVLCAMALTSVPTQAGENRRVRIINRSSTTIRYFYASNVDRRGWEEDILGAGRTLGPNRYIDANLDDNSGHCRYDLKAVLSDGREAVRYNFNVCTESTFTITD